MKLATSAHSSLGDGVFSDHGKTVEAGKLGCNSDMDAHNAMDTASLGFLTKDGIILASYSHNESSRIMELNPYTLFTMVGEPVDQHFWTQCKIYKTQNQRALPLEFASKFLMDLMNCYSGMGVASKALIAGWEGESPILFYVDKYVGCLSSIVFGFGRGISRLNHAIGIGYNYNKSIREAVTFAQWAIDVSVGHRVASSVYYVGAHGWVKLVGDDVKLPPFTVIMNIEDQKISEDSKEEETPIKNWQTHLTSMEEYEYSSCIYRMAGVHGSDLSAFNKWGNRY